MEELMNFGILCISTLLLLTFGQAALATTGRGVSKLKFSAPSSRALRLCGERI